MKKRIVAGTLLALCAALAMGACNDPSTDGPRPTGTSGNPGFCGSFRSCETCTPQNGCGWCYDSDGTGKCASDPSECATPVFEWTWNPNGCRVPAHAGTTPTADASAGFGTGFLVQPDAASPDDVASSACLGRANATAGDDGGEGGSIPCDIEVP